MGGLYSGLLPTLLRDVPEIAIQVSMRPRPSCLTQTSIFAGFMQPQRE